MVRFTHTCPYCDGKGTLEPDAPRGRQESPSTAAFQRSLEEFTEAHPGVQPHAWRLLRHAAREPQLRVILVDGPIGDARDPSAVLISRLNRANLAHANTIYQHNDASRATREQRRLRNLDRQERAERPSSARRARGGNRWRSPDPPGWAPTFSLAPPQPLWPNETQPLSALPAPVARNQSCDTEGTDTLEDDLASSGSGGGRSPTPCRNTPWNQLAGRAAAAPPPPPCDLPTPSPAHLPYAAIPMAASQATPPQPEDDPWRDLRREYQKLHMQGVALLSDVEPDVEPDETDVPEDLVGMPNAAAAAPATATPALPTAPPSASMPAQDPEQMVLPAIPAGSVLRYVLDPQGERMLVAMPADGAPPLPARAKPKAPPLPANLLPRKDVH